MRTPKIIFFIAGMVATAEENAAMFALGAQVSQRNASVIGDSNPEHCDAVAGLVDIPKQYVDFPNAEDVLAEFAANLRGQLSKVGEEKPTKRAKKEVVVADIAEGSVLSSTEEKPATTSDVATPVWVPQS